MKKSGRILALTLALLLAALTACSEKAAENPDAPTEETPAAPTVTEPAEGGTTGGTSSDALIAVEEDYDWSAGVKKNDYGGYEFTILNGCTASWYSYTRVTTEETTGEPVNDAIYERTQRANEFLNINVVENNVSDSTADLKKAVKAPGPRNPRRFLRRRPLRPPVPGRRSGAGYTCAW